MQKKMPLQQDGFFLSANSIHAHHIRLLKKNWYIYDPIKKNDRKRYISMYERSSSFKTEL